MPVLSRIAWIREQVLAGMPVSVVFSPAAQAGRGKCKICISHGAALAPLLQRELACQALRTVDAIAAQHCAVDRGQSTPQHEHQRGPHLVRAERRGRLREGEYDCRGERACVQRGRGRCCSARF